MNFPEQNNKIKVSVALIMALVIASFLLGGVVTGILGLDGKIVDEVGGLRKDMEREIVLLRNELEQVNDRINRKVTNHEKIHHE